jgi:hypothetical protein
MLIYYILRAFNLFGTSFIVSLFFAMKEIILKVHFFSFQVGSFPKWLLRGWNFKGNKLWTESVEFSCNFIFLEPATFL